MRISKFYLMKADNNEESLNAINQKYISDFLKAFGGCTTYNANGFWINNDGVAMEDNDTVCEMFFDEEDFTKKNGVSVFTYLQEKAKTYMKDANQLSVSIVIDGNAYIID